MESAHSHTVNIEKISIFLNRGREESVGNVEVSIVCARKYEMVRMTQNTKNPEGTAYDTVNPLLSPPL